MVGSTLVWIHFNIQASFRRFLPQCVPSSATCSDTEHRTHNIEPSPCLGCYSRLNCNLQESIITHNKVVYEIVQGYFILYDIICMIEYYVVVHFILSYCDMLYYFVHIMSYYIILHYLCQKHVYMYVCIYMYRESTCVYIHIYIYIHTYIHTYICLYVYYSVRVCMYTILYYLDVLYNCRLC